MLESTLGPIYQQRSLFKHALSWHCSEIPSNTPLAHQLPCVSASIAAHYCMSPNEGHFPNFTVPLLIASAICTPPPCCFILFSISERRMRCAGPGLCDSSHRGPQDGVQRLARLCRWGRPLVSEPVPASPGLVHHECPPWPCRAGPTDHHLCSLFCQHPADVRSPAVQQSSGR